MAELIVIRGLPGSGKSTLARSIVSSHPDVLHYEADQYFEWNGVYEFDLDRLDAAHRWCREKTFQGLEAGHTVVVSNTFTRVSEIKPYLAIALDVGVNMRICTATGEWGSVHGVPDEVMERMRVRFANHKHIKNFFEPYFTDGTIRFSTIEEIIPVRTDSDLTQGDT